MILLNLPLSYLFLKLGYVPEVVLIIRCLLNVTILFVRLYYLKYLYNFPISTYVKDVIMRVIYVTLPAIVFLYIPYNVHAAFFEIIIAALLVLLFNSF